jgi:hypothetical protein
MKNSILSMIAVTLIALFVLPAVYAVDLGAGIDVDIDVVDFEPQIWLCGSRILLDDGEEPGRITDEDEELVERIGQYAFEGEEIVWDVLVFDKNKVESVIGRVFVNVDGDRRTECKLSGHFPRTIPDSCNARYLEEDLEEFDPETMAFLDCSYHVRQFDEDFGETFVTVEVEDEEGIISDIAEGEYWFFNPEIFLSVVGSVSFEEVLPGSLVYSDPFMVKNGASDGSNVLLDMFIFGDDFEGIGNCPDSNKLDLDNFAYHAAHGFTTSDMDPRSDAEGYIGITETDKFSTALYDVGEVLQVFPNGPYYTGNLLSPNDFINVVLRLDVPEPCTGEFNDGQITFWAEAV